jgi:hypothetical protein
MAILGDPAHAITDFVASNKVDLVMMPTHGYGPFRQLLLGSVTAKVLHDVRPACQCGPNRCRRESQHHLCQYLSLVRPECLSCLQQGLQSRKNPRPSIGILRICRIVIRPLIVRHKSAGADDPVGGSSERTSKRPSSDNERGTTSVELNPQFDDVSFIVLPNSPSKCKRC